MKYLLLALAALSLPACETLRFGVQTAFGTFSYELPRPTSSK